MRLLPLAAMLAIVGTSGPASATPVPDWMLGDWPIQEIHQDNDKPYEPEGGPAVWWKNLQFHVARDRLAFADWVCQGPHATLRRGTVSQLVAKKTGGTPDDLGLSSEKDAVPYYDVRCDKSLVRNSSSSEHPGDSSDLGISLPWVVIVRSKSRIDMPFQAGSYVVFSRPGPTT